MAARTAQEAQILTPAQALAFVAEHGIVCEAARHAAIPSLVDAIAGAPVRGNWWSHPRAKTIFALTRAVRADPAVLVCRLVDGKITFVHERLWPALARCAGRFSVAALARLSERHTASGKHVVAELDFPGWVPAGALAAAKRLGEAEAIALVGSLLR